MTRSTAFMLAVVLACAIGSARADASTDQAKARIAAAQKKLDDLRDNATADDYRTIQVRGANGELTTRRIPTEEFARRIELVEQERDAAIAELKSPQRSLY